MFLGIINSFLKIIGLFEDDKIIYSFLLACSLGKESKGLMDSEEWKFLLDFTQNQEEAAKNGANGIVSDHDDVIGKVLIGIATQIKPILIDLLSLYKSITIFSYSFRQQTGLPNRWCQNEHEKTGYVETFYDTSRQWI